MGDFSDFLATLVPGDLLFDRGDLAALGDLLLCRDLAALGDFFAFFTMCSEVPWRMASCMVLVTFWTSCYILGEL